MQSTGRFSNVLQIDFEFSDRVWDDVVCLVLQFAFFSARQHMQSALYAIVRPSVCLSHKSIGQKRLKFDYAIFTVQ